MKNDKDFCDQTLAMARWPAPSADLYARIISGTHTIPRILLWKASALLSLVVISAFLAGFTQSTATSAQSPYYAGSGLYIVKYLG